MVRVCRIVAPCVVALAMALVPAAPASGQGGTSTSAGDQQYVDPLNGTTTSSQPAPTSSSPPAATTSSGPSSSAPTTSPPASSSAPTPTTTTPGASGNTLPYTGFNITALAAVGVLLLAGGVLLRRAARRPSAPSGRSGRG